MPSSVGTYSKPRAALPTSSHSDARVALVQNHWQLSPPSRRVAVTSHESGGETRSSVSRHFASFQTDPLLWLIVAFGSLATLTVLFGWFQRRVVASRAEHFAWAAIASGAIANVVDRAARGYVVDFLRLPHWPVFNVADVCIVAGVLGLLLARRRGVSRSVERLSG